MKKDSAHVTISPVPGLSARVTAHQDGDQKLLLVEIEALATDRRPADQGPTDVALVIDRSGSMEGTRLHYAKLAVARFIRSLNPNDRITVVTYDDAVDVLSPPGAPSEATASKVERINAGGSTDLYGGWLLGAKLVGKGGRVVLLSDGHANAGRYTSAHDLARQASISYERYGVTTSTIGIGDAYDEALMAGMAIRGGGTHYFAASAESTMEALSQERFSIGQMALAHVTLTHAGGVVNLGHFWSGETKRVVLTVRAQPDQSLAIEYTVQGEARARRESLAVPTVFGISHEATLELLVTEATELQEQVSHIQDSRSAGERAEALRKLMLRMLAHPLADSDLARSVLQSLTKSREELLQLEREFDESEALHHRKRSMQTAHNFRERAKAFSSFDDEAESLMGLTASAAPMHEPLRDKPLVVHPMALALAPIERWKEWMAVPLEVEDGLVTVVTLNPKNGFLMQEMEIELKRRIRPVYRRVSEAELREALDRASGAVR